MASGALLTKPSVIESTPLSQCVRMPSRVLYCPYISVVSQILGGLGETIGQSLTHPVTIKDASGRQTSSSSERNHFND